MKPFSITVYAIKVLITTPEPSRNKFLRSVLAVPATNTIKPRIRVIFDKAEPATLPTLIFPCPKKEEVIDVLNSGIVVPIVTAIMPIIIGETLKTSPNLIEYLTIKGLILINKINPIMKPIMCSIITLNKNSL